MTVDIPARTSPNAPAEDRRGHRGGPTQRDGRSRASGKAPLVVGAEPRANLLPPEIIVKRKQLKSRRALRAGVALVALVVAAGCIGTFGVASVSQVQLALAQETQQELVAEQAQYTEVRQVKDTIATIKAGQQVGASTEIAWRDYLLLLQSTLPDGVELDTVSIDSGTPMEAFGQSDAPLQGTRVAAIAFTATSAALPSIPDWLRAMADLPGFVDAIPGSVSRDGSTFITQVLLHINSDAFSLRFDPETIAAQEAQAEADALTEAADDATSEGETGSGNAEPGQTGPGDAETGDAAEGEGN